MPIQRNAGADTLALHAGQTPDPLHHSRATPIHFTTSYVFESSDHAAALFNQERAGHVYSRISNPTNAVLEERIAALDGGVGAIACASGQAALMLAITTLMGSGGHIVASRSLYGGSHNLLAYTLPRFGIETTFVAPRDKDAWRAAIRPETRLLFGEAIGNPGLEVLDVPGIAEIAHEARVPLLVDATLLTPALQCPSTWGPTSSCTRPPSSSAATGLPWAACWWMAAPSTGRPPAGVSPPSPSLRGLPRHGLRRGVADRRLPAAGAPGGPAGFRRLPVTDERLPDPPGHRDPRPAHGTPRRQRAGIGAPPGTPLVEAVSWPELDSHPDQALAARLLPKGCGGVFSFSLKGGRKAGCAFIEALRLVSHLANVGDAKSLAIHPASTTHFRMSPEALLAAGIGEGTIRLSVGLENATDLIADLDRGLQAAHKATA
jgi:O-acetylhomoserine (thiol)-lyase